MTYFYCKVCGRQNTSKAGLTNGNANVTSEYFRCFLLSTVSEWMRDRKERSLSKGSDIDFQVKIPPIQRGYVWKAQQVESLWDSIIRRLPIGSFLFSKTTGENEYQLLDGQQRATAIGLGFDYEIWTKPDFTTPTPKKLALWLDLGKPVDPSEGLSCQFRLLTRSHPWGYARKKSSRLLTPQRIKALKVYQYAMKNAELNHETIGYPDFPICCAWPWDAELPIPFSLLVHSAQKENWADDLLDKINENIYWKKNTGKMQTSLPDTSCWKEKLEGILKTKSDKNDYYKKLKILRDRLRLIISEEKGLYLIPAVIMPEDAWSSDDADSFSTAGDSKQDAQDAIESLFIRINSHGTPLEGDDLIYSIYKSIWPQLEETVETIGKKAHVRPSRLISLLSRLASFNETSTIEKTMPGRLNPTDFRRKIRENEKYRNYLDNLASEAKDEKLFQPSSEFLVNGLGRILTADLAQNHQDVYLLLLQLIRNKRITKEELDGEDGRRLLGILTATAWFAQDTSGFISQLWEAAENGVKWWCPSSCLDRHLFNYMERKNRKRINTDPLMYPLPSPNIVCKALKEVVNCWLEDKTMPDGKKPYEKKGIDPLWDTSLSHYMENKHLISSIWSKETTDETGSEEMLGRVWKIFWQRLQKERRLILFAQQKYLQEWFELYEPEAPDQLEDSDRPYDWDHIFPSSYVYWASCEHIWKQWYNTIGNLRAWPLELNRSDSNELPEKKLQPEKIQNPQKWKLDSIEKIIDASYITEKTAEHWLKIRDKSAENKPPLNKILSNSKLDLETAKNLIYAMSMRLIDLYRHWYDTLKIKDTLGVDDGGQLNSNT